MRGLHKSDVGCICTCARAHLRTMVPPRPLVHRRSRRHTYWWYAYQSTPQFITERIKTKTKHNKSAKANDLIWSRLTFEEPGWLWKSMSTYHYLVLYVHIHYERARGELRLRSDSLCCLESASNYDQGTDGMTPFEYLRNDRPHSRTVKRFFDVAVKTLKNTFNSD